MVGQKLAPHEMPQDGRSVAYKAQAGGQSFARPASDAVSQQAQDAGRTPCLSRARSRYPRQSIGEVDRPQLVLRHRHRPTVSLIRTGLTWIGRSQNRR